MSGASRRGVLAGLAGLSVAATPAATREPAPVPIGQPERPGPEAFVARAREMRDQAQIAGDQPYGAVVVIGETIVGEAPSRVVALGDPTAHAEMEAIRDAARRLGRRDLGGAVLYGSSRACPMCEAAAYWAGIGRMVHGTTGTGLDAGRPRLSCA